MELTWYQTQVVLIGFLIVYIALMIGVFICLYSIFCGGKSSNMEHLVDSETPSAPDLERAVGFAPSASQLLFHHNNLRPTVLDADETRVTPIFNGADMNPAIDEAESPPAYELVDYTLKSGLHSALQPSMLPIFIGS